MKLVQVGTFDVANYGDLLFPLVLERKLEGSVEEIVWASPVGGAPIWDGCKPVLPLSTVLDGEADLAAVVLGGGHLLHGGPPGVGIYRTDDLDYLLTYPRLVATATQLASAAGAALLLNAPGVVSEASAASARLSQWMVDRARYVSVRDRASARLLRGAGVRTEIAVVPDTALDVAGLWTTDELADEYRDAFRARGAEPPEKGSIAIHLNPRFADEEVGRLAERVRRIADAADLTPVLLALGPCHGDDRLTGQVGAALGHGCLVVDEPRNLKELAALIGGSDVYLGSSLHGMITACAFGKRGVLISSPLHKFTGFVEQFGLDRWLLPSWAEAESSLEALLDAPGDRWERVLESARPQLDRHWDRIRLEVERATTDTTCPERHRPAPMPARKQALKLLEPLLPELVQAELARSHRARREAETAVQSLSSELREQARVELQTRQAELETHERELTEARTLAKNQRMAAEQAEGRAGLLTAQLDETRTRLAQSTAENEQARVELQTRQAELETHERELTEARTLATAQLDETRTRLAQSTAENEQARRTLKTERAEARQRQQTLSAASLTLRQVRDDLDRIEQSRSWRYGHAFFRWLRWLTFRRAIGHGAVAEAKEEVRRALDAAERSGAAGLPPARPSTQLASGPSAQAEEESGPNHTPPTEPQRHGLATRLRDRIGPPPVVEQARLVSIVVVNRNGRSHLERLLDALALETHYPHIELIVVDNASTDGSIEMLQRADTSFPLRLALNDRNASFSEANNQGAQLAVGELLLLLNNDVQPVEPGWLAELVACLDRTGAGAVGGVLLHADASRETRSGWEIQHRGIRFRREEGLLKGFNEGAGEDPLERLPEADLDCPAVTAACMLVPIALYRSLGGLHTGYSYGTEDVDFCLSLHQRGERVVCCGSAVLLHHESPTQRREGREFMRINRLGNRQLFHERWGPRLWREVTRDRLAGERFWMPDAPPRIAITRTSNDPDDGYGDWYTAEEIGAALAQEGFDVEYIETRSDRWHSPDIRADYVLALLDRYDPAHAPSGATTIAWIRNWTERWIGRPGFRGFSMLLASSGKSSSIIERETGRRAYLFPLATNPERFRPVEPVTRYDADYVFTGNRWGTERPIETALHARPGERFRLYGQGWEDSKQLGPYANGSVAYEELAAVYSSSKVVVDDAATHTLPYDSVNSRVFDALACGTVVITNCTGGVRELFGQDFPTYDDAASLRALLDELLAADTHLRQRLAERYRTEVLRGHTYAHRARQLKGLLQRRLHALRFCIKIGAPSWQVAPRWGDLHFARALQRELKARDHDALIQVLPEWDALEGLEYDVVVHLKGLSRYRPKTGQLNVLWNISHPDMVTGDECDGYDLVCVASERFASELRAKTRTPVNVLEQATDPSVFRPEPDDRFAHELAFVGNSRKVKRRILEDLLPTERDLAVWGGDWDGLIPSEHIVGEYLEPEDVRKVYSSAAIVLNDHWDDMRGRGFVSNRIYDALACGAFVISDRLPEIEERFDGAVVTYEGRDELKALIDHYLAGPEERERRAQRGRELVLAEHTFARRVERLVHLVNDRHYELQMRRLIASEDEGRVHEVPRAREKTPPSLVDTLKPELS